jgi:hypothetical protein
MHDIKYFFSIKIIRQSRGGRGQITENIIEKYYFLKSIGVAAPLDPHGSAPDDVVVDDDDDNNI